MATAQKEGMATAQRHPVTEALSIKSLAFVCALAWAVCAFAQAQSRPADDIPNRGQLQQAWQAYAENLKDDALRKPLLARPGDSLQVLLDMLDGNFADSADDAKIDALIKALSDDSWKVRDDATRKLKLCGLAVQPKLASHYQDKDLEVRARVQLLLNWWGGEWKARLNSAGREMMLSWMSLKDILPVARRNFLNQLDNTETYTDYLFPRWLLLASLRYSEDTRDRDLLALITPASNSSPTLTRVFHTGLGGMAEALMSSGLVATPSAPQPGQPPMPEGGFIVVQATAAPPAAIIGKLSGFWSELPAHDYKGAMERVLDDQRDPAIFLKALSLVEHNQRVLEHLKAIRPKMADRSLAQQVDKFIEEQQAGVGRRAKIAKALASKDDKEFAQGLKDFAAEAATAQGKELTQCLKEVSAKKERLKAVIAATREFRGDSAISAGMVLISLSVTTDADISAAVRDSLITLQLKFRENESRNTFLSLLSQRCDDLQQATAMTTMLDQAVQGWYVGQRELMKKVQAAMKEYGRNSEEFKQAMEDYREARRTSSSSITGARDLFRARAEKLQQGGQPEKPANPKFTR